MKTKRNLNTRIVIMATVLILALITISTTTAAAISCDCGDICVNGTGWWHDGGAFNASGAPIQAAVNAASGGETICVKAGSYTENVNIATAHLTLAGEGAGVITVTAASPIYPVFDVTADYVNISGFTVTGVTGGYVAGIYLIGADHCNISENNASNNCDGIWLEYSSNNTLMSNTANSNDRDGIWLEYSSNNTLTGNTMSGNMYNFGVRGSSLSEYTQNMDTSNTVDGRPIYYWVDQKDKQIPRNAGFVGVVNGTNITVRDLTLTNNSQGALFAYTENSRIENVTASSNNCDGIYLYSSSNNALTNNTANSNNGGGIWLEYSSNNTLTDNDVSYNSCGIGLSSSSNNALTNNTVNSNDDPGIHLYSSSNNTLTDNDVSYNGGGIWLEYSSNNALTNNTVNSNDDPGIYLYSSSNNTLAGNTMSGNTCNFGVYGSSLSEYTQNIDTSNVVDGKPIYYWVDQKDRQIPSNAGFVGVVNGTNITVRDLKLTNNSQGALFAYTENSRIENVTVNSNGYGGIVLSSSSNNTLFNNTASNNSCGIGLSSSSNNTLTNNTVNSNDDSGIHLFSSSNNTLTDNDVSYNGGGIELEYSSNNALTNNTADSNSNCGIHLYSSSSNNITCNWVHGNDWSGFYLTGGSTDNNISYNNIIIAGGYEYQFKNYQSDDVNATNNWWGTTDNDIINASIFDWQDDPNKGIVTYLPKLGSPSPCAPIPELPTATLFVVGLLALVGYVRIRRKT